MTHQTDRTRWARLSNFDQLGNIGSEVGRALNARRRGDEVGCEAAVRRALDLFDATVECLIAEHSPRVKEVLRARDQFLDQLYGTPTSSAESLDQYFNQFALAARRGR